MENEKEKPNFWAVLPATVRYNKNISSTSKLLFAEITALSNKEGYCWASNEYFSELYNITITQVSRLIASLRLAGLIKTYIGSAEGNLRKIYPQIIEQNIQIKTLSQKFDEIIGKTEFENEKKFFLEYWTAKNDGGKKEHWQKQKTFAIRQRWNTWVRNKKSWEKPKFEKFPSDKEIRKENIRKVENKVIPEIQRTPEEQKTLDNKLDKIRASLKLKMSI